MLHGPLVTWCTMCRGEVYLAGELERGIVPDESVWLHGGGEGEDGCLLLLRKMNLELLRQCARTAPAALAPVLITPVWCCKLMEACRQCVLMSPAGSLKMQALQAECCDMGCCPPMSLQHSARAVLAPLQAQHVQPASIP